MARYTKADRVVIEKPDAPDGHVWIVRGPHCWGKSPVAAEALRLCKANLPSGVRTKAWDCKMFPLESCVNLMDGSVEYALHACAEKECKGRKVS